MKMKRIVCVPQEVEVDVKFRIGLFDSYCDPHFRSSPPIYPLEEDFDTREEAEQWKKDHAQEYSWLEIRIIEIYNRI